MVTRRTLVERRTFTCATAAVDARVKEAFANGWQVTAAYRRGCACEIMMERAVPLPDTDEYLGHA
jgi:hypothetical protein